MKEPETDDDVEAKLEKLNDSNKDVRRASLIVLGELAPAALEMHSEKVRDMLKDSDGSVLLAAIQTLEKMDPTGGTLGELCARKVEALRCERARENGEGVGQAGAGASNPQNTRG